MGTVRTDGLEGEEVAAEVADDCEAAEDCEVAGGSGEEGAVADVDEADDDVVVVVEVAVVAEQHPTTHSPPPSPGVAGLHCR